MNLRNPTELLAGNRGETAEHRSVYCPMYALCLNKAVREGWNDWTCRLCPSNAVSAKPSVAAYAQSRRYEQE